MSDNVVIKIDGDPSGFEKSLKGIGRDVKAGMADIKAGIDLATAAVGKFAAVAKSGIEYNANIERYLTSFEVMTGSAERAADVVERLRRMGAETPFEMEDLANTTQLLMQYGFTAEESLDRMRMLGDVAQGNKEAMNSIALGYAQMSSAQKVNLQDIKQMINGGFNPLQEISERTGESMASLYDRISKGKMSVDEITESMRYATSEGGKFFQSMEKQSQTLNGQLSTLKDNANQLLGSLTEGLSEELRTELLPLANNMIGDLESAFAQGGTQGLIDAATDMIPALLNMMSGEVQSAISGLSKWLPKGASALMKAVPGALRGASAAIPQITTALFETASLVVSDLVGMLPELGPVVISGVGDLAKSILKGTESMIGGLFGGIEQAFHQGKSKIAGIWVDDSEIAKFDFKVDMSVDTETATNEIADAYSDIRDALNTDLLTDDQKTEILGMIGDDYDDIKAKLMSFGLSETEASGIADQVTTASDTIIEKFRELDIGVDPTTLAIWSIQANGSRIALREKLKQQGLKPEDIDQVVGVFDTMQGTIKDSTPNIAEEIYAELTDGLEDDPEALKKKVSDYISGQDKAIDEAYNEAVAKLDPTDSDYATKLATLNADYAAAKSDLQTIGTDLNTLVDTLANASTATVQSKYQLLADVESQVTGLSQRIEELKGEALQAGEIAYNVVRSGAKADEATISQAVHFKVTEFRIDTQEAEDTYNAAVAELNEKFTSGEITKEEFNTGMESAGAELEAAKQAAKEAYENALKQIFGGVAEGEGLTEILASSVEKENLAAAINQFIMDGMGGDLDETAREQTVSALTEQIRSILGDDVAEQVESFITTGDTIGLLNVLETWAGALMTDAATALDNVESDKLTAAYKAALESGVLAGTEFDTTDSKDQLANLYRAIAEGAAESASPNVEAAGESLGETATGAMSDPDGAESAGRETLNGLDYALSKGEDMAYKRGYQTGKAYAKGYEEAAEIRSPSRVMRRLGEYTGQGLEIGLRESMANAVMVAKRMTGQIVTAADISTAAKVNFGGLSQEIVAANEQTATPVYLDGQQIASIQGYNNTAQLAWQNARAAKGVGSR